MEVHYLKQKMSVKYSRFFTKQSLCPYQDQKKNTLCPYSFSLKKKKVFCCFISHNQKVKQLTKNTFISHIGLCRQRVKAFGNSMISH